MLFSQAVYGSLEMGLFCKVEMFLEQREVAKIWISVLKFKFSQILLGDKVNSVQEACAKYFAVHTLKFDPANHMKKWNKEHQTLSFQFFIYSFLIIFVSFFMQFARFQILSVKRKEFGKSFLYWDDFTTT